MLLGKMKKILKILEGLVEGPIPHFETKKTSVDIPGYTGHKIELRADGGSYGSDHIVERMQLVGEDVYGALRQMPIGIYSGIEREIVSDLLLRTYEISELEEIKGELENESNNRHLFDERTLRHHPFWEILDYSISRGRVAEERGMHRTERP